MPIYSCKDCTDRHPTCHSTCEKYLGEKAEDEKRKAAEAGDRAFRVYMMETIVKRSTENLKRKKRYNNYKSRT